MKRFFDISASLIGLLLASPVLISALVLIWFEDRGSPFYIATRVGLRGRPFKMIKLRSMVLNADRTGVDSTGATDQRITRAGHFIRRYKLDELPQLWNVVRGDMSLVGPRPNVKRETDLYTEVEAQLLEVRPGVTDFASIVFSDEAEILKDRDDPDLAYNQLIRPTKSALGLFYIAHRSIGVDFRICWLTTVAALGSRDRALAGVANLLSKLGADEALTNAARRQQPLEPQPPPGAAGIVKSRNIASLSA